MRSLGVAIAFLTRVPVSSGPVDEHAIGRSLVWFPVVGAAVGLSTGVVYALGQRVVPGTVAAIVAVAMATWLTGAFHEDGLADTADAFGALGTKERALEIFKDPRLGSFGVLSLVLSVSLRIALLASLPPMEALFLLPAAHALSRGAALQLLAFLPAAAPGLGASYAAGVSKKRLGATALVALVIAVVCAGPSSWILALATVVPVAILGRMSARKVGGVTGDVLGAAQQTSELAVLLIAVAVARAGIEWGWLI